MRGAVGQGNFKSTGGNQGGACFLRQIVVTASAENIPQLVGNIQVVHAAQRSLRDYSFSQVGERTGAVD